MVLLPTGRLRTVLLLLLLLLLLLPLRCSESDLRHFKAAVNTKLRDIPSFQLLRCSRRKGVVCWRTLCFGK
jgi:hypothetical protein